MQLNQFYLLPTFFIVVLSSCAAAPARSKEELLSSIAQVHAENVQMAKRLGMVEESLPVLVCNPELRALLNRVRQECSVDPASPKGSATCATNKLKGAMTQAQHEMQAGSIGLTLLNILRHEVIYLDDHSDHPSSSRETRLTTLAGEKVAKDTHFIIVVSPDRGAPAAERRAKLVVDQLEHLGVDPLRIERPWLYNLHVPIDQLKPADRPGTAEPKDVNRAVFVLRTEC